MLVARLLGVLLLIAVGASLGVFVFTQDQRYLKLARQLFKYGVIIAFALLAVMALERVIAL